jgi:two-component system phosphate regulon sensor histidine kinase PhoR
MAMESSTSFFSPWPDRLRHSAIILLAAALALAIVVTLGYLPPVGALAIFFCTAAAALVPWRLHDAAAAQEDVRGTSAVQSEAVSAVVAGMPDPAVLLDRAGRVLHLNAAAAQLAPALRKNELAQFALRSPEIITALREAIATTEPRRATYLDHVPVDRWMELIITPVPVPTLFGGTDKCMLMTFHDQTPLRRVEEMRADFVANASHELRTPLAALSGFIDTLQGQAKDDAKARERFLGIMHTQATRMARLIDDLLSLSRVELSAHVRPDTSVDIASIIRQVADGLEPLARDRQVVVEIELPETPVLIPGDREELLRLFENLIENALKYGELRRGCAGSTCFGARFRSGDCAGALAAADRALLQGRCRRQPGAGRHRPRPIAGEAYSQSSPGSAVDRKRAQARRQLYRLFSTAEIPGTAVSYAISGTCERHPVVIQPS